MRRHISAPFLPLLATIGLVWSAAHAADLPATTPPGAETPGTETIVLLRHGEKPDQGLGQLNCRGLNRALALPAVIARMFGRPDAVMAPDPAQRKQDEGAFYDYVRPLATVEPTAIAFGLPVTAELGFADIAGLHAVLDQPGYRRALILVAWEHKQIETLAGDMLRTHGGDPATVPRWRGNDFDSLYVLRITRTGSATTARFQHQFQGLDGQPETCPHPPG